MDGGSCVAVGGAGKRLMVRKLTTYQTSLGFFDLAIAAPSMKAAWKRGAPTVFSSTQRGRGSEAGAPSDKRWRKLKGYQSFWVRC